MHVRSSVNLYSNGGTILSACHTHDHMICSLKCFVFVKYIQLNHWLILELTWSFSTGAKSNLKMQVWWIERLWLADCSSSECYSDIDGQA